MKKFNLRPGVLLGIAILLAILSSGCSATKEVATVRVAYFPNMTHSQALVGLKRGDFQQALGPDVRIEATAFNAGPTVIEALFAGQIDIAYIGPNPAVNGWMKSKGEALQIVAGATTGGASLVLRKDSAQSFPDSLTGLRLGSPQLGNTQDVALREFLKQHGATDAEINSTIKPTENATILLGMRGAELDGAWVPEPWATRLVMEADGVRVLDERSLWPDGKFYSAVVIVSKKFSQKSPELVQKWVDTHCKLSQWLIANPEEAMTLVNEQIASLTGKGIDSAVLRQAWQMMSPDYQLYPEQLQSAAQAAYDLGFLREKPELAGLVNPVFLETSLKQGQ